MPLAEIILAGIADAVFGYAFEKGADKLGGWARDRLGLDPTKKAFKEALGMAFERWEKQHPQWVADAFDASFFEHEGAAILAQFLLLDGHPDASELAARWADSLNLQQPERRAFYTRELEPVAADFLEDLAHELKGKEVLRELHDSRAFEQMSVALQDLRQKLGGEKATFGTRRDYLHWLIERNRYLDPRGTFQTQRQVQVKLNEVYISLRAQRDETPGIGDRHFLEKELAEAKGATANLAAEEIEDRREHGQAHFGSHLSVEKMGEVVELAEVVTRYDRVVILGDPGSGKTTLLRYLALKHAEALWDGRSEAGESKGSSMVDPDHRRPQGSPRNPTQPPPLLGTTVRTNRIPLKDGEPTEAGTDLGVARFPILIRIAEYAEDGTWKKKSLSEFLADSYTLHDCPKNGLADLLQTELAAGNCLVLLDGLDEIVSADERFGVVKQIEDFVRHHVSKANRFVITSRKAGYRSAPLAEPFAHYAVREMDETQMRGFLERWCQAVEDAQTPDLSVQERRNVAKREIESIMRAVQTTPGVRRLAANPLLLRTLALIHRTGARLPQKRVELYKLATDTLARTWRPAQGVPESALVKEEYLVPLLSTLAYWLHVNKPSGTVTEREVYEVLGKEWARLNDMHWEADEPNPKISEEVRKFLVAVREHTGLFVERAPKRYGFMHLTFEEYYVARYLVARSKTRAKLIRQHLHQPRWEEPILLALGFVGLEYPAEAGELVETAILAEGEEANDLGFTPSHYEELLGRDYLFALRCLGDNIPVRAKLLKGLIERLANEYLHRTGSARFKRYREALGERLAYLGGSEGANVLYPWLVIALHYIEANVRSNAALGLGRLGLSSPEAIATLLTALHDVEANVRSNAALGLGRLGQSSPEAIATLLTALHDVEANVRSNAALCLGLLRQGSPEAIAALVTALHDADTDVRSNAAWSLGLLGLSSPEAIATLLTALHDADTDVRSNAALGLGRLGQSSPEVIATLLTALHDADTDVRSNAAWSLGQLGQSSPEAIAALLTALHDADTDVRSSAAEILGELGQNSPEVIAALLTALHDAVASVRSVAARSLGRLEQSSPEVIAALLTALHDAEASVRSSAAASLGELGQTSPEVMAGLLEGLRTAESWSIRRDSARLLGQIGQADEATLDTLWHGLLDDDNDVRSATTKALAQLGRRFPTIAQSLVARFIEAMQDPKFDKRDEIRHRPASDYAYDGLWLLVVGGEVEEG